MQALTGIGPGTVVDGYRVEGELGAGGMARVYLVRHLQLDSLHAMKVLDSRAVAVRDRLIQEGRLQASLRHPNIVAVTDVVTVDECPALVMEYVEGAPLDALLRARRLTIAEVDALVIGILRGVGAAHAQGMIHRDLKPANVLLARHHDGVTPKVADFGLAKIVMDAEHSGPRGAQTRTGQVLGTPCYMAPEQFRDVRSVDLRADIYSLGAMYYEMVSGERAFSGESLYEILGKVAAGDVVPLRARVPDVPDRIDAAVRACLSHAPADRPESCEALLRLWTGDADPAAFRPAASSLLDGLAAPASRSVDGGGSLGGSSTFDVDGGAVAAPCRAGPSPPSSSPVPSNGPAFSPVSSPSTTPDASPEASPAPPSRRKWALWLFLTSGPAFYGFLPPITEATMRVFGLTRPETYGIAVAWAAMCGLAVWFQSRLWSRPDPPIALARDVSLALICVCLGVLERAASRCSATLDSLGADLRAYADLSQQPLLTQRIDSAISGFVNTTGLLAGCVILWATGLILACVFVPAPQAGRGPLVRALVGGVGAMVASFAVQHLFPGRADALLLACEVPGGWLTATTLARCTAELPGMPSLGLRRDLPRVAIVFNTMAVIALAAMGMTLDYALRFGELDGAAPQLRAGLSQSMASGVLSDGAACDAMLGLALVVFVLPFRRAFVWPTGVLGLRDALAALVLLAGVVVLPVSLVASLPQFLEVATAYNVIGGMLPSGQAYVDVAPRTFADLDSTELLHAVDPQAVAPAGALPPADVVARALVARGQCLAGVLGTGGLSDEVATCLTPALAATACASEGARLPTTEELARVRLRADATVGPVRESLRASSQRAQRFVRGTAAEWASDQRDGGTAYYRVDMAGEAEAQPVAATAEAGDVGFRCGFTVAE